MVEQSLALQAILACLAGGGAYISSRDPSNDRRPKGKVPKDRIFEQVEKTKCRKAITYTIWKGLPYLNFVQGAYLAYLAKNPNQLGRKFPINYSIPFFVCSIVGPAWRYWCFCTLDKHFTFRLQVQKDQKLIKTGPYRYLAHPSYLGHLINYIGIAGATLGPFNVCINYLSLKPIRKIKVPLYLVNLLGKFIRISPRSLAQTFACLISALFLRSLYTFQRTRIADEEEMMKEHFGEEYKEFLSKRWRMIPFIF